MKSTFLSVPYHLGKKGIGMALGPMYYLETDIIKSLRALNYDITIEEIQLDEKIEGEIPRIINLNTYLKKKVQQALRDRSFPLVLGGDCNTCLGTLAGLESTDIGILWFDAHGDFNTPEISPSGYFDGMPLAIVTGQCCNNIWYQISKNKPQIKEINTIHIGNRDLDNKERELFKKTEIKLISSEEIINSNMTNELFKIIKKLGSQVDQIYLHVDIDIIDPIEAPGVDFPSESGLSCEQMIKIINFVGKKIPIGAAALTAYNPTKDRNDKTLNVGLKLIATILKAAFSK